jgi:hypothetical protein
MSDALVRAVRPTGATKSGRCTTGSAVGSRRRSFAWRLVRPLQQAPQLRTGQPTDRPHCNISDWSDEQLWKAYIQLTQAAAFRIQKDLLWRASSGTNAPR